MNDADWIFSSLEKAAEKVDDLSPAVYARFFSAHPEARELFGEDEDYMIRGHMFSGILNAFMDQASGSIQPSAAFFWASDHIAYETTLPMFTSLFQALLAELQGLLGPEWVPETDAAWRRQFKLMLKEIESAYAAPRPTITFGGSKPAGQGKPAA